MRTSKLLSLTLLGADQALLLLLGINLLSITTMLASVAWLLPGLASLAARRSP